MRTTTWVQWCGTGLALFLAAPWASAQAPAGLQEFLDDQGLELDVRFNFDTGYPKEIFGRSMNVGWQPGTDAEFEQASRDLVDLYPGMFGYGSDVLDLFKVYRANLTAIGSSNKVAVVFRQVVEGLPVEDGYLTLLWSESGRLLNISNRGLPGVGSLDLIPRLAAEEATRIAAEAFGREVLEVTGTEILIAANDVGTAPALVWKVGLSAVEWEGNLPVAEAISVDARDGRVLRRESQIHAFTDLIGYVRGKATPGTKPDTGSNPAVKGALEYVRVSSPVGSDVSATDGRYDIAYGGASPQTVTVDFGSAAPYARVINQWGKDLAKSKTVTPGVKGNFVLNSRPLQRRTAQVNAHASLVKLLNFIAAIDPNDKTMYFRQTMNVNINSSCNAYYNGSSTNYYRAAGGCANTAYSTVVAHETGHWANDKYGQGNGSDGFGEGNADNWGTYVYDDNLVGEDFCGPGCHVRNGNNSRKYCNNNCCSGCYGGVHADGEVLMGACWKVRTNLNNTYGDAGGDLIADTLFVTWVNAYPGDRCICQYVDDHWLEIDDDNGNLADGTPNSGDIDGGFKQQGFPGYY